MGRKTPKNKVINQEKPTVDLAKIEQVININDVNKIAIRRGKVRELFRMGYEPHQIILILDKGIKIGNQTIKVPISEQTVRSDIEYIRQEDAAVSIEFPEKRAEVVDKLKFLYQQAIKEYINAKGAVKNSFLNTALSILNKLADIEGVNAPEALDVNINAEAKVAKFSAEVQTLGEEDRNVLITAIRQILGKREQEPTEDDGIPSESPGVSTQTSDDERIPRES
jgi:hypothetical protein